MTPLADRLAPERSVLVIDDNVVNRRVAQGLFRKLGWAVDTVDSGEQALPRLRDRSYDLILLDISMPGMNGMEVCQHIRTDPQLMDVRVIAYTAHALLEEQQHFLAEGFDGVLLKPINLQAIQELLVVQMPCE